MLPLCNFRPVLLLWTATLIVVVIWNFRDDKSRCSSRSTSAASTNRSFKTERDSLWRIFNESLYQLAVLQCQQQARNSGAKTSTSGAYCDRDTWHVTDSTLVTFLRTFMLNKTVASFGDGFGVYKSRLDGYARRYDAYDGAWFSGSASNYTVRFLDLAKPVYGLPDDYDLVISLEVAEHIPEQYMHIYMDNLARYAKSGIVLSWATPSQPGYAHVNGRTPAFVSAQMLARSFRHEPNVSARLREHASLGWLKRNTNYYVRDE